MQLSEKERLTISLLARILDKVDPDSEGHWAQMAAIVERGYELEYDNLLNGLHDPTPEALCEEVREILHMYRCLQESHSDLGKPEEIPEDELKFSGFDGNNETSHMGYARFVREQLKDYEMVEVGGDGINSHAPTLWKYRPMLKEFKKTGKGFGLSAPEIARILEAGRA